MGQRSSGDATGACCSGYFELASAAFRAVDTGIATGAACNPTGGDQSGCSGHSSAAGHARQPFRAFGAWRSTCAQSD